MNPRVSRSSGDPPPEPTTSLTSDGSCSSRAALTLALPAVFWRCMTADGVKTSVRPCINASGPADSAASLRLAGAWWLSGLIRRSFSCDCMLMPPSNSRCYQSARKILPPDLTPTEGRGQRSTAQVSGHSRLPKGASMIQRARKLGLYAALLGRRDFRQFPIRQETVHCRLPRGRLTTALFRGSINEGQQVEGTRARQDDNLGTVRAQPAHVERGGG